MTWDEIAKDGFQAFHHFGARAECPADLDDRLKMAWWQGANRCAREHRERQLRRRLIGDRSAPMSV